jgi:hypothetical protein
MFQAAIDLLTVALKAVLQLIEFVVEHPPLAVTLVVVVGLIVLAENVHDFLLLPLGIALLLAGVRLRADGH